MIQKRTFGKIPEHQVHDESKNPKDTTNLFQRQDLVKPVNLRGELDSILSRKAPEVGQFEHLRKVSVRTLTTAPVDYKRQMIDRLSSAVIDGEDLCNVQPLSNVVPREKKPNSTKEYHDLIWNFDEVMHRKMPVDYPTEEARHHAVRLAHAESRQRNPHASKPRPPARRLSPRPQPRAQQSHPRRPLRQDRLPRPQHREAAPQRHRPLRPRPRRARQDLSQVVAFNQTQIHRHLQLPQTH